MTNKDVTPDNKDLSTEEKIRQAARQVFLRKGFAATRTRDIAEEAGINLALLNYYFRSKQKLFEEVMLEKVQELFGQIGPVLFDASTTLETKIETIVSLYIDIISVNPDLPLFVLSEIRNHPGQFAKTIQVGHMFRQSAFVQQLALRRPDLHPLHLIMNIMGMTIFPFIAAPVLFTVQITDENEFASLMRERKRLIPLWVKSILETH